MLKRRLDGLLQAMLAPIRARRAEFARDIGAIERIIAAGTEEAREVAACTLDDVRAVFGLSRRQAAQFSLR